MSVPLFARSTVPAAIDGFLAQIRSAVPDGVGVYDTQVQSGQSVTSLIVVTGWENTSREPATMGGPHHFAMEEQYDITGYMRVVEGSSDQTVSRNAVFDLWAAVENAVMSDQTLGGAVRVSWLSHQVGTGGSPDGARGNGTQIDFLLHCQARLS